MEKQLESVDWPSSNGETVAVDQNEFDLLLCFRVLLSYWWLLAPLAVIGAVCGLAFCYYVHPVYRAYCRFEIFQNVMLNIGEDSNNKLSYKPNLWRHILIMKSEKLNANVRQDLEKEWGKKLPEDFDRYKLNITPVNEAPESMVDMYVDSFDPEYSSKYLQKLIEGYEISRREETELLKANTLSGLRHELDSLSNKLEEAQNDVARFESEHNIYFVHEKTKSDQDLLATLMKHQSRLRTQIAILDAQFPFLTHENAATLRDVLDLTNQLSRFETSPKASNNAANVHNSAAYLVDKLPHGWSEIPEWRENEALIMRLNADYQHFLETYKPGHIKMIELNEQIEAAERELEISAEISLKRLQSIRDALKMQEQALLKTAQKFEMQIDLTAAEVAEYEKLKSRAEYLKEQHYQAQTRIMDNTVSLSDQYYTRLVEGIASIQEPVWPIEWKIATLSILGFTGIGSGLILLSYFVRVRLYDFQALEQSLNLTCIAGIPRFKKRRVDRKKPLDAVIMVNDKSDFASECYRSLRTNIEQKMNDTDKIVLITSPDPGEGKTFTALNLAIVFSWNKKKVLIVDGDFRRRTFRKLFKDAPSKGFIDCLPSDDVHWKDCIVQSGIPKLDYLPAGRMSQNTTELLTLSKVPKILDEFRGDYDIVILDSAPVNRVVDTMLLAKEADCVILVAKAGKTKTNSMRYSHSRLNVSNIIGYILNNVDSAARKYGYYNYGYSYYSAYHQYKSYSADVEEEKEQPA